MCMPCFNIYSFAFYTIFLVLLTLTDKSDQVNLKSKLVASYPNKLNELRRKESWTKGNQHDKVSTNTRYKGLCEADSKDKLYIL